MEGLLIEGIQVVSSIVSGFPRCLSYCENSSIYTQVILPFLEGRNS